jgi:hypothetical protein
MGSNIPLISLASSTLECAVSSLGFKMTVHPAAMAATADASDN